MADPKELYALLNSRAGFETKQETATANQIRIVGSVPKHQMGNWLSVMHRLLLLQSSLAWKVDISKQYFLRSETMVYGWRLIFQGTDIASHLPEIMGIIHNAPKARHTLEEYPLPGASPDRNAIKRGRGASSISGDAGIPTILRRGG